MEQGSAVKFREGSWLGRGLEDVARYPFGWAFHQERDEIRAHLRRRIWRFGFDGWAGQRLEQRVDQIQRRLHKYRPTLAERQAKLAASRPSYVPPVVFTPEELAHIAEHFQGANDPLAQAIWHKASRSGQMATDKSDSP